MGIGYHYINYKNSVSLDDIDPIVKESLDMQNEIARLRKRINEIKKNNSCVCCGSEIENGLNFCPYCGKEIPLLKDVDLNFDETEHSTIEIFSNKKKPILIKYSNRSNRQKINAGESKIITELNERINEINYSLNSNCITIGKKYYKEIGTSDSVNINMIMNRISENEEKIRVIEKRSLRIKTFAICPECSEEVSEFYEFCPNCGRNISVLTSEIFGSEIIYDKKCHRVAIAVPTFTLFLFVCIIGTSFFGGRSYTETLDMYLEACYTSDYEKFSDVISEDILAASEKGLLYLPSIMPNYSIQLNQIYGKEWAYRYKIKEENIITTNKLKSQTINFGYYIKGKISNIKDVRIAVSIVKEDEVMKTDLLDVVVGKQGRDWCVFMWDFLYY